MQQSPQTVIADFHELSRGKSIKSPGWEPVYNQHPERSICAFFYRGLTSNNI